jgi:hypothetical protein
MHQFYYIEFIIIYYLLFITYYYIHIITLLWKLQINMMTINIMKLQYNK